MIRWLITGVVTVAALLVAAPRDLGAALASQVERFPYAESNRGPIQQQTPACQDPTPNGGGQLVFSGIGMVNHNVTRQGDVCPGVADVWTFSDVDLSSNDQFLGVKVVQMSGTVSIVVTPPSGTGVPLVSGDEWRATVRGTGGTYRVTVTGTGSALASYRIEVCRALLSSCVFSDQVTTKPGDVDCDGTIDSRDATLILLYTASLIPTLPCQSAGMTHLDSRVGTSIDATDAEVILQLVAGLIHSIPLP